MSGRKPQSKRRFSARQLRRLQGAREQNLVAMRSAKQTAKNNQWLDERLREVRRLVRGMSRQLDELELIIRTIDVLESKRAARGWFNGFVPTLGGRPIDLCQTARGRLAVLRELGRIEHGVHS